MRGRNRALLLACGVLLAVGVSVLLCAQVFAQAAEPASSWRPIAQKRVVQAVLTFTTLGMFFIGTLAVGAGGLAMQLWARVTFPRRAAAILTALEEKRWKSFLVGLVNLTFLGALFAVCANVKLLGWLAAIIAVTAFVFVFFGLLGRAERLGARLWTAAGRTPNAVASVLVGWPVLYFALISLAFIPLLGWALLLYLMVSGAGAVVLSLLGERAPAVGEPTTTG